MRTIKSLKCLIVASIVGISSQSALAYDDKSIPGTNCVEASNQDNVSYPRGHLKNDVNGPIVIFCPIVRDNMSALSQHFHNTVKIRFYKRSSRQSTCILSSSNYSGSTSNNYIGSVSGTGYQSIYIPKTIRSYTSGLMNISCFLNAGDELVGINYSER